MEEDLISTPLNNLLIGSKKLPEALFVLNIKNEEEYLKRVLDTKKIEDEFNKIMDERRI